MLDQETYKKLLNIPFSVIIASFIIIVITTNTTDSNGLSALLGGYSGLLVSLLFIMILNWPPKCWMDMFPFLMVMTVVSLLIYYLSVYFKQITSNQVVGYYYSFSVLSTIFLAIQISIIFNALFNNVTDKLFNDTTFALLGLLSTMNIIVVLTIGIVLHFYSTQG
jgi:F0F1-type ATP synthase assembly protein I